MTDTHNTFLTSICEQAEEMEFTVEQVRNIAADLVAEFEARAEADWEWRQECQRSGETYRNDVINAGRGHLLGDRP